MDVPRLDAINEIDEIMIATVIQISGKKGDRLLGNPCDSAGDCKSKKWIWWKKTAGGKTAGIAGTL